MVKNLKNRRVTDITITVTPITDDSIDLFGKKASDLQSDVNIGDSGITGHLYYVTDYTGFSSKPEEQQGNYLAIHSECSDPSATIIVNNVTLQEDGDIVLIITDKDTKKVQVTAKVEGKDDVVKVFSLSGLECDPEA